MKTFATILLLMLSINCMSQNLVLDYSFEEINVCPYQADTVICVVYDTSGTCIQWSSESWGFDSSLSFWKSFAGTPNYFNACANISRPEVGVPSNFTGNHLARSGDGYVGIETASFWPLAGVNREYIGSPLQFPLNIGDTIYASAYVKRAITHNLITDLGAATNNLGFKFSTVPFSQHSPSPTDNWAHIVDTSIITDTVGWTKISGQIVADSAYAYVIFGNFFDDAHTDTLNMFIGGFTGLQFNHAYYFVDDVCVSKDSLTCLLINNVTAVEKDKDKVTTYPNPSTGTVTFSGDEILDVSIFDSSLKLVKHSTTTNSVDVSSLSDGMYFYRTINEKKIYSFGKLTILRKN